MGTMAARVLYRDAQGRTGEVPLAPDQPCYIGRALDCAVRTDDAMVSRRHSLIRMEAGRFLVEDLGSSNGTHVNDVKVSRKALTHNDVVRCGNLWLRYVDDAAPASVAEATPTSAPARKVEATIMAPEGMSPPSVRKKGTMPGIAAADATPASSAPARPRPADIAATLAAPLGMAPPSGSGASTPAGAGHGAAAAPAMTGVAATLVASNGAVAPAAPLDYSPEGVAALASLAAAKVKSGNLPRRQQSPHVTPLAPHSVGNGANGSQLAGRVAEIERRLIDLQTELNSAQAKVSELLRAFQELSHLT
jgi:predicted component of type VI protein secretion system